MLVSRENGIRNGYVRSVASIDEKNRPRLFERIMRRELKQ